MSFGNRDSNTPPASPSAQLVLAGNDNEGYNLGTKLWITGYDNDAVHTVINFTDEDDYQDFFMKTDGTNGVTGPTWYLRGKVGINTTSPARTLHVVGNITVSNDTVARSDIYWDSTNNRLVIRVT
jgi:hypothetical protein